MGCVGQFTSLTTATPGPFLGLNASTPLSKGMTAGTTGLKVVMAASSSTSRTSNPDPSTSGSPVPPGAKYSKTMNFESLRREANAVRRALKPDERL